MKPSEKSVEERMMEMYLALYGEPGNCSLEFCREDDDNEYSEAIGINVMKSGSLCSTYSREDLVFEYVTADWGKK